MARIAFAIVGAALALSGCAHGRLLPAGVSGNETYVVVSNIWNAAEAQPYAEKHCRAFGKAPRLKEMKGTAATFDCVRPDS